MTAACTARGVAEAAGPGGVAAALAAVLRGEHARNAREVADEIASAPAPSELARRLERLVTAAAE